MAVIMLKTTRFNGLRTIGTIYSDLTQDVENRWIKNGIAQSIEVKEPESKEVEVKANPEVSIKEIEENENKLDEEELKDTEDANEEDEEENESEELSDLSAKQLFKRCKDKGLNVKPKMNKEYYLEILEK